MKKRSVWLSGALLLCSLPMLAQHDGGGHGGGENHGGGGPAQHGGGEMHGGGAPAQRGGFGGGYIPQRGPEAGGGSHGAPAQGHAEVRGGNQGHPDFHDAAGHPNAPHVDPGGRWVGHAGGGAAYHLDRPWQHGHFPGNIGNSYVYRLGGGGPNRFFFNGFYFGVAGPDLTYVNGWDWASDDVVLYDDPDDPGYYLAYNPRLGVYVHVQYLGR